MNNSENTVIAKQVKIVYPGFEEDIDLPAKILSS